MWECLHKNTGRDADTHMCQQPQIEACRYLCIYTTLFSCNSLTLETIVMRQEENNYQELDTNFDFPPFF